MKSVPGVKQRLLAIGCFFDQRRQPWAQATSYKIIGEKGF